MKVMTAFLQIVVLLSVAMAAHLKSTVNDERTAPVAVGEAAPDFTLQDQNGQRVKLSEARDKSPVVLVFYRGYW